MLIRKMEKRFKCRIRFQIKNGHGLAADRQHAFIEIPDFSPAGESSCKSQFRCIITAWGGREDAITRARFASAR